MDARQGSESEWSESEWLESLFTSTLNKITKKIGQKHRTPSKKKKIGTPKVFQRLYVFHLYAQRITA